MINKPDNIIYKFYNSNPQRKSDITSSHGTMARKHPFCSVSDSRTSFVNETESVIILHTSAQYQIF
jgi:hypothetical protein